jgi:hypothetical protein
MSYSEVSFNSVPAKQADRQELCNLTDSEEVLLAHEQHYTIVVNL